MEISQGLLCLIILYAAGVGALLGVLYDIFRIARIAVRPRIGKAENGKRRRGDRFFCILTFFADLIYALLAGAVVAVFLFNVNDGQFRWFALFGAAVGYYLYYVTVGKLVVAAAGVILHIVHTVLRWIMTPFRLLCALTRRAVCAAGAAVLSRSSRRRSLRAAAHGFQTA